jgi:signal transduction histidine kinase
VSQQLVESKSEHYELSRRTRLLNSLIWILMGALGLFLVYVLAAGLQSWTSGLISLVAALVISGIGYWLARSGRFYAAVYLFLSSFVVLLLFVVFMGGRTAFTVSEETGLGWGVVATAIMISFVLACMSWLFGESINNAFSTLRKRTEELRATKEELRARNEELQAAHDKLLEAQEQLIRSEKLAAIGQLASGVGHELRTPLNVIIGFSELMLDRVPGPVNKKQRQCLEDILSSGRHLLGLIDQVLDLSKIESGRTELKLTEVSLPEVIESLKNTMLPILKPKRQSLTVSLEEKLPPVYADKTKLRQVFFNLLSNSSRFTPQGGRIEIKAVKNGTHCRVSVADNGVGIKKEDQERIFDPFYQLDNSPNRQGNSGTGLGLVVVKQIVEKHGGRVWVESQYGKGSRFSFTLPLSSGGKKP